MPDTILATKLHIPPPAPALVPRARLIERLTAGTRGQLTLLSAPAGFGKTTLVANWIATARDRDGGPCVAWLALEEEDDDPTRFLTYLVAALRTIAPGLGGDLLERLQSGRSVAPQPALAELVNELASLPADLVLVLDDLHVVAAQAIADALAFLLDHLPPPLHLVVTTRSDPHWPLARLRARGQLTELRAGDLRFTQEEASEFLNRAMGLELSPQTIAALEARTEGWIAGLQLAALSMQGRRAANVGDMEAFVDAFTGSHRYIMDYLVEEVLQQQSAAWQRFLLRTAILDRLSGPLCDAVVCDPETPGQATLEAIERANLFMTPLDDERRWYRYHQLFAELLRKRLAQTPALDAAEAHRRASAWYEENGHALDAFHHAVAARDTARAARLVAGGGMPLYLRGAAAPVLAWLESLPQAEMDAQPALWVMWASALTMTGAYNSAVEEKLAAAEAALPALPPGAATNDLLGQIAANRAMLAVPQNAVETILAQALRARELLDAGNLPLRTTTAWSLGYAYQIRGERAAAARAYAEAADVGQKSGNLMAALGAITCLGQLDEAETRLHDAAEHYRHVLELLGDPPLPMACEAYLGLARLHYEWDDLEAAHGYALRSLEMAQQMQNVDTPAAIGVVLAHVHLARGDDVAAAAALADATHFAQRHGFEHQLDAIAAARIRLLLHQGRVPEAAEVAAGLEQPLSRARVLLAQDEPQAALALLAAWRQETERKEWADERLHAMVLQALAHTAAGSQEAALHTLGEALALAQPAGYIQLFAGEGELMARLLADVEAAGTGSPYTQRLLATMGEGAGRVPVAQPLVEPLSERELDVLRQLATELTGPEIARTLHISLNTLRTHTKNIYSKLGANNRIGAVHRAEELGLL